MKINICITDINLSVSDIVNIFDRRCHVVYVYGFNLKKIKLKEQFHRKILRKTIY